MQWAVSWVGAGGACTLTLCGLLAVADFCFFSPGVLFPKKEQEDSEDEDEDDDESSEHDSEDEEPPPKRCGCVETLRGVGRTRRGAAKRSWEMRSLFGCQK